MTDRRPRHYAQEIAELPKLEDRRAALEEVLAEYRELVVEHVKDLFERRKHG